MATAYTGPTDETTILPNGTQGHYRKRSNAERPVML
jgi:hypothetical protein